MKGELFSSTGGIITSNVTKKKKKRNNFSSKDAGLSNCILETSGQGFQEGMQPWNKSGYVMKRYQRTTVYNIE